MNRRLVILTEIISPYRIPLFNALAAHAEIDLHVIFLSETDPSLRQWQVYKSEIRFSYEVLPSWRTRIGRYNVLLNSGLGRALKLAAPHGMLCGGYSYLASWQALVWTRARSTPFLLWSESNLQDARRGHAPVEFLKDQFLRQCTAFVVPGQSAGEYLRSRKIGGERIFTAPNAVENDFFAAAAANARANAAQIRSQLGLRRGWPIAACVRGSGGGGCAGNDKIRRFRPAGTADEVLFAGGDINLANLHRHLGTGGKRSDGKRLAGDSEPGGRMRQRSGTGWVQRTAGSSWRCRRTCIGDEPPCATATALQNDGRKKCRADSALFSRRMG